MALFSTAGCFVNDYPTLPLAEASVLRLAVPFLLNIFRVQIVELLTLVAVTPSEAPDTSTMKMSVRRSEARPLANAPPC